MHTLSTIQNQLVRGLLMLRTQPLLPSIWPVVLHKFGVPAPVEHTDSLYLIVKM